MFGEFLTAHKAEIVERCLAGLRQECPDHTDTELTVAIPSFVDDLIVTINLAVESFIKEERADQQKKRAMDLGFLAHEIRNSVSNAVIGFQLIQKGKAPADGNVAAAVERALTRITTLVMDTIEAAQALNCVAVARTSVRLKELFDQLTLMPGTERGIRLSTQLADDLQVDADPRLLVSAISNLLQNAMKFTRDNESVCLRGLLDGNFIKIEVEDRCGGLHDSEIDSLFRPFVKKRNDGRGAGLGLPIALRAIEAQGGTLNVRNMPGIGCVFSIHLPHTTTQ
jgi:signal transduction histidine kinase